MSKELGPLDVFLEVTPVPGQLCRNEATLLGQAGIQACPQVPRPPRRATGFLCRRVVVKWAVSPRWQGASSQDRSGSWDRLRVFLTRVVFDIPQWFLRLTCPISRLFFPLSR